MFAGINAVIYFGVFCCRHVLLFACINRDLFFQNKKLEIPGK